MKIEKYSEAWLTGFAEETADLGLDETAATDLLKFAAALEFKDNPEFQEGFDKAAAGLPGGYGAGGATWELLKKIWSTPVGATLGTLGLGAGGAGAYYGLIRPNVGVGPYEKQFQKIRDAVDYGFLDPDQALAAARMGAIESARRRGRAAGEDIV